MLDALEFFKINNPLYADVDVNAQWLQAAMANDAELCEYLVELQNHNQSNNATTQSVADTVGNVASPNAPGEIAMDCSDNDNAFLTAQQKLNTVVNENGFTIHDVPSDGDCMFSAILYTLNSTGLCDVDSDTLRQTVAS